MQISTMNFAKRNRKQCNSCNSIKEINCHGPFYFPEYRYDYLLYWPLGLVPYLRRRVSVSTPWTVFPTQIGKRNSCFVHGRTFKSKHHSPLHMLSCFVNFIWFPLLGHEIFDGMTSIQARDASFDLLAFWIA